LANDPEEPAKALPTDEPFEVWWPKYLARVKESVEAAEQHLEVPAGTISSIPGEPDFIATVKTYAVIEPVLNDLIAARPPQPNYLAFGLGFGAPAIADAKFRAFVTSLKMSGPTGKLRLAEGLGLLTQGQIKFIDGAARVRNRYAHNVKNMHRSLTEMLTEEQTNNAKIVANVTGMQIRLPSPIFENDFLKAFMYHRLADYLADALHTLRPPPLPAGGLLGGLGGLFDNGRLHRPLGQADANSTDSTTRD
jgi:hypothetical protein